MNLGIIGLGYQGKRHLNNCFQLKQVNLVAVADTSKNALEYATKRGIKNVYTNYEDLLKNKQIDAVIISLPNFLHLNSAVKVAEAGKNILLEKPLARNLEEGKKILSSVDKNGVKLMMGYTMRFNPLLKGLQEKIFDGFFGEVQIAQATNISNGPFTPRSDRIGPSPVPNWWFDKELVGGGALLDLGIHMIDLFTWYFGEVESVSSYLGYKLNMSLEDTATCVIRFKRGPIALVNAGWFSKDSIQSISIAGTSRCNLTMISSKSKLRFIWNDLKKAIGIRTSSPSLSELRYFVDCVQNDVTPSPSGQEGLVDLQIISMAYKNASRLTEMNAWNNRGF